MSVRRLLVLLVLALGGFSGCAPTGAPPSASDVPLSWRVPTDACRHLALLRLARDARWLLERPRQVRESFSEPGGHRAVGCTAQGDIDLGGGPAPLDGGTLSLAIETATDPAGVESIRRTLGSRGDYDDVFASRGSYEVIETPATGWWSQGSTRVYRQDAGGETRDVPRVTRVTVIARILDDNLTASVLVNAQVLADDPERIERLETLAIDALRALGGALERTDEVEAADVNR